MTGPTRAGDKSTGPRYRGRPTSMGDGFAGEHGLVEKDLSRGEAHICNNHTAVPWMFEAAIVLELRISARYSAITALATCTIPPPTAAG